MVTAATNIAGKALSRRAVLRNLMFFFVFLGAAVFAVVFKGKLPEPDPMRIESGIRERFWQLKVRGRRKADFVVLGNSRVNQAVSPSVVASELPGEGWSGLNLAFNWGGLNPTIYQLAESRLDFDSSRAPIVILGVSPAALTLEANRNDHYKSLLRRPWLEAQAYLYFPRIAGMLSREEIDPSIRRGGGMVEYHDDGWQGALRRRNAHPEAWLNVNRRLLQIDRVRPELREQLLEQTRAWTERGVYVFGFHPPSSPAMRELEIEEGAFDEAGFARDFEAHGGHWIEIDPFRYQTYDNSHLPRSEAVRLSSKLGREISRVLIEPSAPEVRSRDVEKPIPGPAAPPGNRPPESEHMRSGVAPGSSE